ncbi:DUF4136 domain-containing protein [Kordiimonas pumila]|uniref:DUF4136 domain-containing protein n=1 Tax=Kordiimonas pumila TaxID=2161677 RepID=A0ABV7DAM9_9PROT|nr:DUF4136 domain-containing protein [Kordiimonas pumila]
MNVILNRLFLAISIFALSACATTFRSNVATFHEMTVPGGERVMLVPMNAEKKDSLEYRQYANVIASHLKGYGYKETGESEPELIAGFDVTVNDGREKLETRPGNLDPYWHGYWSWGRYWHSPGFYGDPFGPDRIVASTVYTITLTVELRKPTGEVIFEGRADTEVRSKSVPEVVPFLADALFQNFPGESGKTRRVVFETEQKE